MRDSPVTEFVKATPPAGVLGAWVAGYTVNEWAATAALVYTLILIGEKVGRWILAWHLKRRHAGK